MLKYRKVPNQEKLFRNIERQQQIKRTLSVIITKKRRSSYINGYNG
jgi:hypothetical protein